MKKLSAIFRGDSGIWVIFIFMSIVSILAVFTSIGFTARTDFHSNPYMVTMRHIALVFLGYLAVFAGGHIEYKKFARIGRYGFYVSIVLLFIALIFFHGRRIHIPVIGGFQPSEIAKICLIMYVARMLSRNKDKMDDKWLVPKVLIPVGLTCALIFPENLSTAIITFVACFVMMFVAGVKKMDLLKWMLVILALVGLFVLFNMLLPAEKRLFRFGTWSGRITRWVNPEEAAYRQENMSYMAIARGGLFGCGIGNTIYGRLMTQAHNDFIYAVIVEEAGSLFGIFLLIIYSILYFRCLSIAWKCDKIFGRLMVIGLATLIYVQAWVHISVAVGVIPVTGQTLPFISYGGTAYVFLCCGLGAIQSVAYDQKKRALREKHKKEFNENISQNQ